MNATEQHVALAAQMYECRAAARRLLGDKFRERMEERARIVRAVAKRDNCNDIVAGATIIKETGAQGMDALLMMAAVVEMTEPSNVGVQRDSGGIIAGGSAGTPGYASLTGEDQ